ncbi:unnamed protein product [Peronospora belbahrii]|uniref:Uncharacterized protein n=1 Tax=Peronospora belbahrii TaxID=622444 RepID=A0AAU9L9B7_9STRA|nr:unnamed protein product [Peronospora belbahrii]CAH0513190.1 unnamed protein product [Peronospora belbahrii]
MPPATLPNGDRKEVGRVLPVIGNKFGIMNNGEAGIDCQRSLWIKHNRGKFWAELNEASRVKLHENKFRSLEHLKAKQRFGMP